MTEKRASAFGLGCAIALATVTPYASSQAEVLTLAGRGALVAFGILRVLEALLNRSYSWWRAAWVRGAVGYLLFLGAGLVHADLGSPSTIVRFGQSALVLLLLSLPLAQNVRLSDLGGLGGRVPYVLGVLFFGLSSYFGERSSEGWLGVFANPNALGGTALAALLVGGHLWLVARTVPARVFLAGPLLGLLAIIYYSGSRASLLAAAAALGWALLVARWDRWRIPWGFCAFLLACGVAFLAYADPASFSLDARLRSGELMGKNVSSGRQAIWPKVLDAIGDEPWVGHGLGSRPGESVGFEYSDVSAHNGFLQVAYQSGLLGLGGLLFCFARVYSSRRLETTAQASWARACCVAAVLHEMAEVCLTQNHFGMGFGLWVACIL